MKNPTSTDFQKIAAAIAYIEQNFKAQPSLEQIAASVDLSPAHFQRLFTDWAGTSPKKFLQYISIEHAKKLLHDDTSLLETSLRTGLSGTSRLHDLFVTIEGMTPGEYKNGGEHLMLNYSFAGTPFGRVIIASTHKGIAYLAFADNEAHSVDELTAAFPHATYTRQPDQLQRDALAIFSQDWSNLPQIKLHLKGTPFQLKVWHMLLTIPLGRLSTYGRIAQSINQPTASRAVGTAIGQNPVAFLIPCHRVVQSTGVFGNYHWSPTRKTAIIGWESAKNLHEPDEVDETKTQE